MATPTRQQITEKALQLWHNEQFRNGTHISINPTTQELKECGIYNVAQQILMQSNPYRIVIEKKCKSEREELLEGDLEINVEECLKSGIYVCGTTGSGKSDVAMYVAETLQKQENAIVIVFDPSQDWQERSSIPRYTQPTVVEYCWNGEVPQESIIYDTSQLTIIEQQAFIEDFVKKLMKQQTTTQKALRKQHFLIFEEAHIFFPEGCMRAKRYQNTVFMMTNGRNYKVRFACITQFSSLLDKKAMKYMKQRYFGATDEPNDVEYVVKFFPKKMRHEIELQLTTLKCGEFIYKYSHTIKKVSIEPFHTNNPPTHQKTPECTPQNEPQPQVVNIPRMPIQQADHTKVAAPIIIALIWLTAIIFAIGGRL